MLNLYLPKSYGEIKQYLEDPLYKNSLLLASGRALNVASGFLFWILAARLYSIKDIGIATALISSLGLILLLSRLGFDFSLIRFLPLNDKNNVFNTCLTITTIASLIIGAIYILGINFFSPALSFVQNSHYSILFLFFVLANSLASITGNAFTAIRRAEHYFLQNIFLALRIPFLYPLITMGAFGVFSACGLAYFFSSIFSLRLLSGSMKFNLKIDKIFIKESFRFSSGNYVSRFFSEAPPFILPLMIINLLGEAEAAKYYIAFAIGNLIFIIPEALSTSLFVECSHGESLKKNVLKAALGSYIFLIPVVVLAYFFGDDLLGFFGRNYIEAFTLLKLLVLSSLLVVIYSLFIPIQNVRMKAESVAILNFTWFIILMGLSYIFISRFGIVGIGYAWLIAYGVLDLAIAGFAKKMRWI
ncbi:MAG: lipopolysaccharide biosynthesis protein [Peptococcaceae bacterium]|nr:MAG: lipopolysaccharide biosynthesis protein [Peptococcaceae bacterium]